MSWQIDRFKLVSGPADPGLFCGANELTLGGVPLLNRTDGAYKPRTLEDLQRVFDAAYGERFSIEAQPRLPSLRLVASALNDRDLPRAIIASLMLRLPDVSPLGMSRLNQIASCSSLKYDEEEDRDQHGRWTAGANQSGSSTGAQSPVRGRWPDIRTESPNITPTQAGAVPLPPIFPWFGGTVEKPKPKDDDFVFPPSVPTPGLRPSANDNATTNEQAAANENRPNVCPDPTFELNSVGRTAEQLQYQAQITGLRLGFHVMLNAVGYDGCRESDQTMLEAKFTAPWFLHLRIEVIRTLNDYLETVGQAFQQNYRSGGRKVEWHFADPQVSAFWRAEFSRLGLTNIVTAHPCITRYRRLGLA